MHERAPALNLTDPLAINVRAKACRSVHDIVRFTREKAVAAMVDLGDEVGRQRQRVRKLASSRSASIFGPGRQPEKAGVRAEKPRHA